MLAMIQYDCLIVIDDIYNVKQITRDLFARFKYCLRQHCFCKNWIIWKVFHKKQMTVGILTGSVGGKWGKFLAGFQECGCARASNRPECPPIYPYEPPNKPLARPHLLVPAVPADEDLDGVLGDSRGGSWGLCLTHL